MKRVVSNRQLIFIFTCVLFIVHTLAEQPEAVNNGIIANLRLLAETSSNSQSRTVIGHQNDDSLEVGNSNINITNTGNWAGAVLSSPPSGTFNSVSARWTVPTLSRPSSASGPGLWRGAQWVGIDGTVEDNCTTGLLQAGVASSVQVSSSGVVTNGATAWYEWLPNALTEFSGFSVAPGDTVEFSVTATSNSQGTVVVNNLSAGTSTNKTFGAPTDSSKLCGIHAEWIVEDFSSDGLVQFANFTPVYFENCAATTTTGDEFNLAGVYLVDMIQNNTTLATAAVVNSAELEVTYG